MNYNLALKTVSLFLVLSVCLLGYTATITWAHPFPVPGAINIDPDTTIYQSSTVGSTVQIFFADSMETLDKLTVDRNYIQVNDGTKIGVHSVVDCDLNLTSWEPVPEKTAGTVAEFSINSAGNWVPFQFYIGNLKVGYWYNVFIDGQLGPRLLTASNEGSIGFAYSGIPGIHDFEVRQFALAPPMPGLLGLIVLMLIVGVVVGIIGETTYQLRRQQPVSTEHMVKSLVNMTLYVVIAVSVIGVIYALLAGM